MNTTLVAGDNDAAIADDWADYFEGTKNNAHIFLYSVAGRSSSTAFQRIVNSGNTVWMWGEQNYLVDSIIFQINEMKRLKDSTHVKRSLDGMKTSFDVNKHDIFYPNAIGNLKSSISILNSCISNLLKPGSAEMSRFGFKDIQVLSIETMKYLKELYPSCFFVFCFRDPIAQWPSVNTNRWWDYSHDIERFLDEYARLADIYMEFSRLYDVNSFVESSDLRSKDKVQQLLRYLMIPAVDESLIENENSVEPQISEDTKRMILESKAYARYQAMRKLSATFFKQIMAFD